MILQNNSISSNNFGLHTNFSGNKTTDLSFGMKKNDNTTYYAKKGEPMYMKEMDADEDGIVTFDEFKDYCKENGISTKDMTKMVELANSYSTMQSQKKAENIIKEPSGEEPQIKEAESEAIYAKRGDGKYNEDMDTNKDDKVSYKEYIEYCNEHAKPKEKKSDTQISKSENGEFKTTSAGKALNTYSQSKADSAESFIDVEG